MKKYNILVVLPWWPTQMTSGGNQAIYNGLKAVEKDGVVPPKFEETYKIFRKAVGYRDWCF